MKMSLLLYVGTSNLNLNLFSRVSALHLLVQVSGEILLLRITIVDVQTQNCNGYVDSCKSLGVDGGMFILVCRRR